MRTLFVLFLAAAAAAADPPQRGAVRGKELEAEAAGKASTVKRPKFYGTGWEQRVQVAEQLGKPVIYWVDCSPLETDDADEFLIAFPEAVHVLVNSHPSHPGKTDGVVFRGRDGFDYWVSAGRLNATTAATVRGKWEGEKEQLTAGRLRDSANGVTLTAEARRRILSRTVETEWAGRDVDMTLDGFLARGGTVPASYCKAAGLTPEETAWLTGLGGRPTGQAARASSPYAAGSARAEYTPAAAAAPRPVAPPPAPRPAIAAGPPATVRRG